MQAASVEQNIEKPRTADSANTRVSTVQKLNTMLNEISAIKTFFFCFTLYPTFLLYGYRP